jgi:trk system potassium uptake protein TrkH
MSAAGEGRAALHITSIVGGLVSAAMLVPAASSLAFGWGGGLDFLISALVAGLLSLLVMLATRGPVQAFTPRFGFLLVNMLWWLTPVVFAVPLMIGAPHLSLVDAVFETASGITTTGSTVMTGLDHTDRSILLWRSITQWFGGVGILSLGLILLPYLNVGGMQLFRMESSDRSEKALPRFVDLAKYILQVYLMLSIACMLGYMAVGMAAFDAINHAMTTVSTGGFSTHDASMGYFDSLPILWVGALFMMLGGMPFTLYLMLARMKRQRIDPQVPIFLLLIAVTTLLLLLERPGDEAHSFESFSADLFNTISIMTTTGYAAGDYTKWGGLSVPLFFVITFFGGCAGSTAGGLKTYRLIVNFELIRAQLQSLSHPSGVFVMRYGGRRIEPEIFRAAMVMAAAFIATMAVMTVALGICGLDFLTAMSGSVTALANVGPGLGDIIGPAGTFAPLPDSAKLILSAGMILGRLEILAVLVLFTPPLWRG